MSVFKSPWQRRSFCICVFFVIGTGGIIATGRWAFTNDALLYGWLDVMRFFHPIGLFKYTSDEDMDGAVIQSLACFWFPLSALAAWQLNRWLKRSQE